MRPPDHDREWTDEEIEERIRMVRALDGALNGSPISVGGRHRRVIEGVLLKLVEEGWLAFSGISERGMTYQCAHPAEEAGE